MAIPPTPSLQLNMGNFTKPEPETEWQMNTHIAFPKNLSKFLPNSQFPTIPSTK